MLEIWKKIATALKRCAIELEQQRDNKKKTWKTRSFPSGIFNTEFATQFLLYQEFLASRCFPCDPEIFEAFHLSRPNF
jgi:hypothetical protein